MGKKKLPDDDMDKKKTPSDNINKKNTANEHIEKKKTPADNINKKNEPNESIEKKKITNDDIDKKKNIIVDTNKNKIDMKKIDKKTILNVVIAVCTVTVVFLGYQGFFNKGISSQCKKTLSGPAKVFHNEKGWHLTVGDKPFFVKGVCYRYTPIGKGADYDIAKANPNAWKMDAALMAEMGVNTIRLYQPGDSVEDTKKLIRIFFDKHGIKTALGNFLGFWDWPPANYSDPAFREKIQKKVLDMVNEYKDEDGILFWILGNENNYSFDRGIRAWSNEEIAAMESDKDRRNAQASIYYRFLNQLAKEIKKIDPNHPVVMGNGELSSIHIAQALTPDIDILGGIVYQGKTFSSYFQRLERNYGKPNVFIEFGADRYDAEKKQESEDWQAFFLKVQWQEIINNAAGKDGEGNSLGGFVFEWCDEWWKFGPGNKDGWTIHDTKGSWSNTAYYFDAKARNNMDEEWFGVVGLDPLKTKDGVEKRVLTKSYYVLKSAWAEKKVSKNKFNKAGIVLSLIILSGSLFYRKKIK